MQVSGHRYWVLFGICMVLLAAQALLKHCSRVDLSGPEVQHSASRIQPDKGPAPSKEGRPLLSAAVPVPLPDPAKPAVLDPVPNVCRIDDFAMPGNARIFAAGGYRGEPSNLVIDQSGNQAGTLQVAVNKPGGPVVLLLGAYEPTVWTVSWTKETYIAAVLLTGYHRQQITGLPADVPILISTYDNRGPCGYAYVGGEGSARLNPLSRAVFGRPVDTAYAAQNGRIEIGRVPAGRGLTTDPGATSAKDFHLKDQPLPGQAGLDAAVRAGILRNTTPADLRAWNTALARSGSVPRIVGADESSQGVPYRSYTVLRPFVIPAGLHGAHSATFFVERGVPAPTGDPRHSAVLFIENGTCAGRTCGMR